MRSQIAKELNLVTSKRLALYLIAIHIVVGFFFLSPSYIRPDSIAVQSWLRSLVVDGDFLFFDEWAGFQMLGNDFAYFKEVTPVGALANHWWIGTSVATAPFYLTSHTISILLPGQMFSTDGFFGLDLATSSWSSVFFHALTMAFAWLSVRRIGYPNDSNLGPTVLGLCCVSFGTPAFWYAFRMPIGTHATGMMMVGLLTLQCFRIQTDNEMDRTSWNRLFLVGMILGLGIATRIQHVVLVPAVLYALNASRRTQKEVVVVAIGATAPLLVQGAAWFAVYGNPIGPLAAGANLEGITWMPFHRLAFFPVLFSSWRGLFVWSPIWAPAILGLVLLARDHESEVRRRAGVICLLMFAGELFANATLDRYWWGGMSFGPRRFVDLTVPAAVGVCAFLGRTRLPGLAATALTTVWSVLLMLAASAGTINLSRFVDWGDLFRGIRSVTSELTIEVLRSPITSASLAIQSVIALLIIGLLSTAFWLFYSAWPRATGGLAFTWVFCCLLVTLAAIAPTHTRAGFEAGRFNLTGEAARRAGPLIDQRGLISDELAWLESTGRRREAQKTREEIKRINKELSELGKPP